ncbi:OLC1v1024151C1 [Oldenlandia corymbosa var. corymbosa]|uniref:OLC1v1024151C1 n=1 Tax=Oldenlandia corymbosa var. corymbosa TaxID=529605 RepID=A0AAV1C1W4_OLDCO|nr:OLC1v1024151C1 [Oldenlandia corymbosa var. corymbosa]
MAMMRNYIIFLASLLCLTNLFLASSAASASDTFGVHEAFVQCLSRKSLPNEPISGLIYTPNNSSFSTVLQTYIRNLRFNETTTRKPYLIITPTKISHIQSSILCAKQYGLLMKIRSGGHDYEGVSYVADSPFFILDLFNFRWQEIADKLDDDLFIRMIIDVVNDTSTTVTNAKTIRSTFFALFLGDSERLLSVMNKSFPELGLKKSDCTEMNWAESVVYYTSFPAGTPVEALLSRIPQVLTHLKRKSDYLKKPMPIDGIEFIFKKMIELQTPVLTFNPYGGKMAEISPLAKPFPHRAGNIAKIQYATNWPENGVQTAEHYLNLTKQLFAYMTPYVSKNPREHFLNYRDLDIGINHNGKNKIKNYREGRVYGVQYFLQENFKRLVKVKTVVDPDNFFRNEQSIPVFP